MTTWTLIIAIFFSAWTGPTWYSWDTHGQYILPGVWIGPGESPGFVAWPAGYGTVLGWYWGPRSACPPVGCASQTDRNTAIELNGLSQPVQALAGRRVHIQWLALLDHEGQLAAVAWQSFGYGQVTEHRIYSCPAQAMPPLQWVYVGCEMILPPVDGLLIGPGSSTGFGLAVVGSYGPAALQVQDVKVWQEQR